MLIEEIAFTWHETLGVPPNAAADTVRLAMRRLGLRHHPDHGGSAGQTTRIYARATNGRWSFENRPLPVANHVTGAGGSRAWSRPSFGIPRRASAWRRG